MMQFSKNLLLVLGGILGVAFVALMFYDVIQINQLHAVAIANRSAGFENPRNWVMLGALLGLVSGLLLGMGIAMPSKSFKARYAETRKLEEGLGSDAAHPAPGTQDSHVADARGSQANAPEPKKTGAEHSDRPQ